MQVVILTEGGRNTGFGHLTRCIALYQAIEQKGWQAELFINADKSILDFVCDKKYRIFNWLKDVKELIKLVKNSDSVIIDSYLADKSIYDRISKLINRKLLMIDDYRRLNYPPGIVVNPSIYGDKLNYPQKEGRIYLLGKNYIILRKEFCNIHEKVINKEVRNILITFGGRSCLGLVDLIVKSLGTEFNFDFLVLDSDTKIINSKQMLDLMLKADICISGGGQTTYELARVGVPTIGICFADNQRLNLKGWQEKGFVEYIGWHNDDNLLEKLTSAIDKFMSYEERVRRSEISRNCVDGKGVKRVIKTLFNE